MRQLRQACKSCGSMNGAGWMLWPRSWEQEAKNPHPVGPRDGVIHAEGNEEGPTEDDAREQRVADLRAAP